MAGIWRLTDGFYVTFENHITMIVRIRDYGACSVRFVHDWNGDDETNITTDFAGTVDYQSTYYMKDAAELGPLMHRAEGMSELDIRAAIDWSEHLKEHAI